MSAGAGGPGRGRGHKKTAKPSRAGAQAPSQRQLRVAEQIRHLLADALLRGQVHDPRLAGLSLTIGEVRVSPDLRHATVYANELGRSLSAEALAGLSHAAPWLGGLLAREMHLKYAPRLQFVGDTLYDEAARLERLLEQARARPGSAADEVEHDPAQS